MIRELTTLLIVVLLGSSACHQGILPQLTATPTADQPFQNPSGEASAMTPALSPEISFPPTATKPPLAPLSVLGGGVIAFQTDCDRQDEIYMMNADGSDQRLLISNQWALDSMPIWSPEGARIAFASRDRGKYFEIRVVTVAENLQGINGESVKLTNNDFDDLHPTWSPDGNLIAFRSNRNDQVDIYLIRVDGSSIPQQLTRNSEIDQDRAPSWRPNDPNFPGEDDE